MRPRRPWPAFPAPAVVPVYLTPRRPSSSITATRSSGGNGTGTDPTEHPHGAPTAHQLRPQHLPPHGPGRRHLRHRAGLLPTTPQVAREAVAEAGAQGGGRLPGCPPTRPACGSRFIVCSRLSGAVIGKIAGVEGVEHDGLTCVYIVSSLPTLITHHAPLAAREGEKQRPTLSANPKRPARPHAPPLSRSRLAHLAPAGLRPDPHLPISARPTPETTTLSPFT